MTTGPFHPLEPTEEEHSRADRWIGISEEKIGEFLGKTRRNILGTSLVGLMTLGPLAPFLPLLGVLRDSGLPLPAVVAFITSQTLVGPLRAFLEIDFFGVAFFT